MNEEEGATVGVWANPFSAHVVVTGIPQNAQVEVLNSLGVLIHRGPWNEMDWRGRSAGLYVLRINASVVRVVKE